MMVGCSIIRSRHFNDDDFGVVRFAKWRGYYGDMDTTLRLSIYTTTKAINNIRKAYEK